jgi:6-phosphogluconolactonase
MNRTSVNGYTVNVAADERELFEKLAAQIAEMATGEASASGLFTMLLSGGSTPRGLYETMARLDPALMPWDKTYLFLGDERCVSHSDGESNYKMVKDSLLSSITIPSTNVFPTVEQDKDPQGAAKKYEQTIRRFFNSHIDEGGMPDFSLALMGLGPDGHTASLFPGTDALSEEERLCVANFVPKFDSFRLTLTLPVFAHAENLFFLVAGEGKAEILKEVLLDESKGYPSQIVAKRARRPQWWVDEAAFKNIG